MTRQEAREAMVAYENAAPIPLNSKFAKRVLAGLVDDDHRVIAWNRAILAAEQRGAKAMQAEIVAWLRASVDNPPADVPDAFVSMTRIVVSAFSDAIERTEHRTERG